MTSKIVAGFIAILAIVFAGPSQAEVLKIGTTVSGQPMSGRNPQTKEWEGVALELLMSVAKDADLQIEFVPMIFAELQPALLDKKIDVIAGGYGITPEREKVVDFTNTYGEYRDLLVVPVVDIKPYRSVADFKGMKIAVPKGSAYVAGLKEAGAEIVFVNGPADTLPELEAGHVAGVIDNGLQLAYRLKIEPHPTLKIVNDYTPIQVGRLAFAVQKGNADLLTKLNASLARLQANGTVKTIKTKWGLD